MTPAPVPPDGEPRRWFVGVSADRPMEIQFTEANGPGGWVQSDDHERAVAAAFAAGRAAASPDERLREALTADAIAAAVMEWDRWPCRATTDKRPAMRAAIAAALDTAALAAADREAPDEET